MSATIDDKLTQVKPNTTTNAPVTTVATSRSIGGTSLSCVDLTDWPTDTAVHFQTYQKKADGTKDFTTAVDMKGIVSSNTIGSIVITNGTDAGNAIGDFVELNPTAAYGEGVYEWGTTEHNVDGTHASITSDSLKEQTASGFALKDSSGNEYLKTSKTASAVNEITIANAATGNAPQVSATGGDTNIDLKLASKGTGKVYMNVPAAATASVTTSETTTSTSYADLATTTDTVTVSVGPSGIAIISLSCYISNNTANAINNVGVDISSANTVAASDATALWFQAYAAGAQGQMSQVFMLTGLTAGSTVFKMKYKVANGGSGAGTGTFKNRRIAVWCP